MIVAILTLIAVLVGFPLGAAIGATIEDRMEENRIIREAKQLLWFASGSDILYPITWKNFLVHAEKMHPVLAAAARKADRDYSDHAHILPHQLKWDRVAQEFVL